MAKRRLALAAWLVAAALLWLFENNAATLSALVASVLLPVVSAAAARRRKDRVRLSLSAPPSGQKGGAVHAVLSAESVGFFSRVSGVVLCENSLTAEKTETAFAFSPRLSGCSALTLEIETAHCGAVRLCARAWTEDMFGVWRSKPIPCDEEFITVEPELFPIRVTLAESVSVSADSERYSLTRPGSDPSETFAIREYAPGDPIRQIHWKLSQKTDRLMLRELGLPVADRTLLVFRNGLSALESISPERADAMAEVFLSVSRALSDEGLVHTAAFVEDGRYTLFEVQGTADHHAVEERLLALSWGPDDGALARLLAETAFEHAAVVSAAMPPDADSFRTESRVTVLTASPAADTENVRVLQFSAALYAEELRYIEI